MTKKHRFSVRVRILVVVMVVLAAGIAAGWFAFMKPAGTAQPFNPEMVKFLEWDENQKEAFYVEWFTPLPCVEDPAITMQKSRMESVRRLEEQAKLRQVTWAIHNEYHMRMTELHSRLEREIRSIISQAFVSAAEKIQDVVKEMMSSGVWGTFWKLKFHEEEFENHFNQFVAEKIKPPFQQAYKNGLEAFENYKTLFEENWNNYLSDLSQYGDSFELQKIDITIPNIVLSNNLKDRISSYLSDACINVTLLFLSAPFGFSGFLPKQAGKFLPWRAVKDFSVKKAASAPAKAGTLSLAGKVKNFFKPITRPISRFVGKALVKIGSIAWVAKAAGLVTKFAGPFGMAVSVGLVIYDIYNVYSTVKDIHQMESEITQEEEENLRNTLNLHKEQFSAFFMEEALKNYAEWGRMQATCFARVEQDIEK